MGKFFINQSDLTDLLAIPLETKGYLFFRKNSSIFQYDSNFETGFADSILSTWTELDRLIRAELINHTLTGRLCMPFHRRTRLELRQGDSENVLSLCKHSNYYNSTYAQLFGRLKTVPPPGILERILRKILHIPKEKTFPWEAWFALIADDRLGIYRAESEIISARIGGVFTLGDEPIQVIKVAELHEELPTK